MQRTQDAYKSATSGATIRRFLFLGDAEGCRNGVSKPISLLAVAHSCCVLRPEWCQQWCQTASTSLPGNTLRAPPTGSSMSLLCGAIKWMWQWKMLCPATVGRARRGESTRGDLILSFSC